MINFFDSVLVKARNLIQQKDYQKAEQNLQILRRQNPNRWEPIYETIRLEKKKTKNDTQALQEYEKLASTFVKVGIIQYQIAKCHTKLKNYEQAYVLFELAGILDLDQFYKDKIKRKYQNRLKQQVQNQEKVTFREQVNILNQCEFDNYIAIYKDNFLPQISFIWLHQYNKAEKHLLKITNQERQNECLWIDEIYLSYCFYLQKQYQKAFDLTKKIIKVQSITAVRLLNWISTIYLNKQCLTDNAKDQITQLNYNLNDGFIQLCEKDFYQELILRLLIENVELFQCAIQKQKIFIEIENQLKVIKKPYNNFRFRLLIFQFKMLFQPDFNYKQEEQEINQIIKSTQQFAYGYYLKFCALVKDDRREQAKLLLEQVAKCNDSYEKFITMAEILLLKQEMSQAQSYLHKAEQIDKYDNKNLNMKVYIEYNTNQYLKHCQLFQQIYSIGICPIQNSEIKFYLQDYLFKFEYYKALNLIQCPAGCPSFILLTNCIQTLNNYYLQSKSETTFNYGQQIKQKQLPQIEKKKKLLSQYNQILNDQDLNLGLEIQTFQKPLKGYQKELICNQILFGQQHLTENQLCQSIINRYCEVLINLFDMFMFYFTVEIENYHIQSSVLPNSQNFEKNQPIIPLKKWKRVSQCLIELTFEVYRNFAGFDLEKFTKEWSITLKIILGKGQTPFWMESIKSIFKKIEGQIIRRIEKYDYNMYQYGKQLKEVYDELYFFDGISKLALTDFVKIMGFSSCFRDMIEVQDFDALIIDQIANRKYEQFYQYQTKQ